MINGPLSRSGPPALVQVSCQVTVSTARRSQPRIMHCEWALVQVSSPVKGTDEKVRRCHMRDVLPAPTAETRVQSAQLR
jgi:hypothetical protein